MKKIARDLVVGDVVSSGEIVLKNVKSGHFNNVKCLLTLKNPKTDQVRLATWGYYSTIFMKKPISGG